MKMKKIGKIVLGILVGALVFLLLLVLFWLGPTVKLVAQKVGIKALGTPLTIQTLSINPRKGTLHLSGFAIANQGTFSKSNAVSLTSLDISLDMGSIFTKTVVVHQVEIQSPHFIYEQSMASDNITEFILNIQEFAGIGPDAPPKKTKEKKKKKSKKEKEPTIVVIESLKISDVQFHLANTDDSQLDLVTGFEDLSVSMTNGVIQLNNFYVRNPGRLTSPNLFTLDQVSLLLEPESVYSSNITITAVQVSNPQIYIEHNPESDTVGEFLKIATSVISHIPTPTAKTNVVEETVVEGEVPPTPTEVILHALLVKGTRLHVVNIGDPKLNVHFGVDSLDVSLDKGKVSIENIHVTNPKRLTTPNLFSLDTISVDFAPESLKADTFIINDVQVLKPYAFLELNKEANTTGEFLKIADGFIARAPTYAFPESGPKETDTEIEEAATPSAPPFELHNLLVDDIAVHLLDSISTNTPSESHMLAGINSVSVKLVEGHLQIAGITVPNLKGFTATNLFHLANIDIQIDPESVHSGQVVIREIFVNSPRINLEQTEDSGNVSELQLTLANFTTPPKSAEVAPSPTNQIAEASTTNTPVPLAEQPVVLHSLIVTNLAVNMILPSSTNEVHHNVVDGKRLHKLNPMEYIGHDETNEVEAIEYEGPLTLVTFKVLSVEPLKGLVGIDDMEIANIRGFANEHLAKIQRLHIALDPDTIQTDTLLITEILIEEPRVSYERKVTTDNIKALQEEIEKAAVNRAREMGNEPAENAEEASDDSAPETEGQKVIIEHLLVTDGMVRAKLSVLPTAPIPLPDIELVDIGKEEGGASISEASGKLFEAFYDAIIGAVASTTGFATDALKGAGAFTLGAIGLDGEDDEMPKTEESEVGEEEEPKKKRKKRRGVGGRRSALR